MEIVFIPTEGAIDHGDNIGNITTVSTGEAQIISAGRGMVHNSYNHDRNTPLSYIQMWIFPQEYEKSRNLASRKAKLEEVGRNRWQPVASPEGGEHV